MQKNKKARPKSSHLERENMASKGFILWPDTKEFDFMSSSRNSATSWFSLFSLFSGLSDGLFSDYIDRKKCGKSVIFFSQNILSRK